METHDRIKKALLESLYRARLSPEEESRIITLLLQAAMTLLVAKVTTIQQRNQAVELAHECVKEFAEELFKYTSAARLLAEEGMSVPEIARALGVRLPS